MSSTTLSKPARATAASRTPRKKKPADPNMPKRPPGRPRKYPNLTEQEVKQLKKKEKQEAKAKAAAERLNPQRLVKDASIVKILDVSMPGSEGENGGTRWKDMSLEQRQQLREAVHTGEHYYILQEPQDKEDYEFHSKITWIKRIKYPEDPPDYPPETQDLRKDPSDVFEPIQPFGMLPRFRYYKVGPVLFPFSSPHYIFDVVIEKRPEDSKLSSVQWHDQQRALAEAPRRVYIESFELNKKLSFEVWPPTAGYLIRLLGHAFRDQKNLMISLMFDGKAKDYKLSRVPMNSPKYGQHYQQVSATTSKADRHTVFRSMTELERHLFAYPRVARGFDPLDPNPATNGSDYHLLHERCVWLFRELFLGAEYFRVFKYFHPVDLVGQTHERISSIVRPEIIDPEKSPKRVGSMILNKFLRPDRVGIKFRNGEALVRFINDYVSDEDVLNVVLPPFADVGAFGCKRSGKPGGASTSSGPAYHNPLIDGGIYGRRAGPLAAVAAPIVIRNPASPDAVATWYDSLRNLYLSVVAIPFSAHGDLFSSHTVEPAQVEYMEFLISRGFVEVYPNIQATSDAKYIIEKHLDMQTQKHSMRVMTDKLVAASPSTPDSSQTSSCAKDEVDLLGAELEVEMLDQQKKDVMQALVKNHALNICEPVDLSVFASGTTVMTKESRVRKQLESLDSDEVCWIAGSEGGEIFGKDLTLVEELYSNESSKAKRVRTSSPHETPQHQLLAVPQLIEPSAVGALEPLVIYPKVAAEMAHAICESVLLDVIVSPYVHHVQKQIDLCLRNAFFTEKIPAAKSKRDFFSDEEFDFLKRAKARLAEMELYGSSGEIVMEKLEDMILTRDPMSDFKALDEVLASPHRANKHGPCYLYNSDAIARIPSAVSNIGIVDKTTLEQAEQLLDFPIVLVDFPFSYAEKKREEIGPNLLDLACGISTFNIGPEELHLLPHLTEDSLFYRRTSTENRFVVLKELEKWPIQHLKEAIQTTFYNWRASRLAKGNCSLWIFADFSALDVGALSVLLSFAKGRSYVKQFSLRDHLVKDSFMSGIAARLQLREPSGLLTEEDVESYLCLSMNDEQLICKEHYIIDPVTKAYVVTSTEQLPLPTLSLDQLYLYRNPSSRPAFAKVHLSSLSDWRQLYTMTCYVTQALVLIGTERILQHIYDVSRDYFQVVLPPALPVTDEDRKTSAEVVAIPDPEDPAQVVHGRLRFRPSTVLDIWSSMRIKSAVTDGADDGAAVVHV